jgi:hypothetical protein
MYFLSSLLNLNQETSRNHNSEISCKRIFNIKESPQRIYSLRAFFLCIRHKEKIPTNNFVRILKWAHLGSNQTPPVPMCRKSQMHFILFIKDFCSSLSRIIFSINFLLFIRFKYNSILLASE